MADPDHRPALSLAPLGLAGYWLLPIPDTLVPCKLVRGGDRRPFVVGYEVRRKLRAKTRSAHYGKALKLHPSVDRHGRQDLRVKLRRNKWWQYHRLVGFRATCCTCVSLGPRGRRKTWEVEPFQVCRADQADYEVNHMHGDPRNCKFRPRLCMET